MVIDFFGLAEAEVRQRYPAAYQHILLRVKLERIENAAPSYRGAMVAVRRATAGTAGARSSDCPATSRPSRPRSTACSAFCRPRCCRTTCSSASRREDAFHLGVLSSRIHVAWALRPADAGRSTASTTRPAASTRSPSPTATAAQRTNIAAIAEELDALRRTRLDAHPQLTMTGLYNVLEKLRAGQPLTTGRARHPRCRPGLHHAPAARRARCRGGRRVWLAGRPRAGRDRRARGGAQPRAARRGGGGAGALAAPRIPGPRRARRARPGRDAGRGGRGAGLPPWPARDPERYVALRASIALAPRARPNSPAASAAPTPARCARCWRRWPPSAKPGVARMGGISADTRRRL